MTSLDYYVGFETEPTDLDAFLDSQGYDKTEEDPTTSNRDYESREESKLIDIFYFQKSPEAEGSPNWKRAGYRVTSEVLITTKESGSFEEQERLANELIKKFNAILYNPLLDEFF